MDKSSPKVSVLMSVYNGSRYLQKSIKSILTQTFADFEFIIINDCSTDNTEKILREYSEKDERIVLINNSENLGLTKSLNKGLSHAQGEFIARMDYDDIAISNRLEKQVEYLRQNPNCVAVGSEILIIDPDGSPIGIKGQSVKHEQIEQILLSGRGGAIVHPSVMMSRLALEKVNGYNPEFVLAQDLDLFLRLAEIGVLANIPQVLLKYRQHFNRMTDVKRDIQLKTAFEIVTRARVARGLGKLPENSFEKPRLISPRERREQWIKTAITHNYYLTSYKHLFILVMQNPHSLKTWKLVIKTLIKLSLYNVQKLSVLLR